MVNMNSYYLSEYVGFKKSVSWSLFFFSKKKLDLIKVMRWKRELDPYHLIISSARDWSCFKTLHHLEGWLWLKHQYSVRMFRSHYVLLWISEKTICHEEDTEARNREDYQVGVEFQHLMMHGWGSRRPGAQLPDELQAISSSWSAFLLFFCIHEVSYGGSELSYFIAHLSWSMES